MRHQIFQGIERQVLARHQGVAVGHGQTHGLEITQAVVGQIAVQARVDGEVGDGTDQQRITVRRGLGHRVSTNQGA